MPAPTDMSTPLRALFLRLLLLSVFLTGAVGMPLHEARHLRDIAQAVAASFAVADDGGERETGAPREEAEVRCAWCHAFCDSALASPPPALAPRDRPAEAAPCRPATLAATRPGHWRYASRDPPPHPA